MSDTNDESTTLLMQLRREGLSSKLRRERLFSKAWPPARSVALLIEHVSEFPVKVQEAIQKEKDKGTAPTLFFNRVQRAVMHLLFSVPEPIPEDEVPTDDQDRYEALLSKLQLSTSVPGNGFNFEIDTQEQVELALRFFPILLTLQSTGYFDGIRTHEYAPLFVSASSKSLPFAPLIFKVVGEFAEELGFGSGSRIDKNEYIKSIFILYSISDDEYDRKLDEVGVSSLKYMTETGFIQKDDKLHQLCKNFLKKPCRIRKSLFYLLEWDPGILRGSEASTPLLWGFVGEFGQFVDFFEVASERRMASEVARKEEVLGMFRMVFELGMVHYPKQLGFIFHTKIKICEQRYELPGGGTVFENASRHLGEKRVRKMVNEVVWKITRGDTKTNETLVVAVAATESHISLDALTFLSKAATRRNSNAILNLIVAAATNKDTQLEALYYLCRRNPAVLIPSIGPSSD